MSRGNRRHDMYLDDVDRQGFLKTLAEACQKAEDLLANQRALPHDESLPSSLGPATGKPGSAPARQDQLDPL